MTQKRNIPTIVVVGYNRPQSLLRLLDSLSGAEITYDNVTLVISLDFFDLNNVRQIAEQFEWPYGPKKLITHKEHLGLKNHIYSCGDLSNEYDSIIVLEDDLVVSPYFFDYAIEAVNFYHEEESVASISLYAYHVSELDSKPFYPLQGTHDAYFMQVPSSWGQIWTTTQWNRFCQWRDGNQEPRNELPLNVQSWSEQSWKKVFYQYLLNKGFYVVFPYLSLTTNFNDKGTHIFVNNADFQVPLQVLKKEFSFPEINQSKIKYDAWFEPSHELLDAIAPSLMKYDYEVDLRGTKTVFKKDFILTNKYGVRPILSWSDNMQPIELNIANNIHGVEVGLYNKSNIRDLDQVTFLNNPLNRHFSVGIVVVIESFEPSELNKTLASIVDQEDHRFHVIIVCPYEVSEAIQDHIENSGTQSSYYTDILKTNNTGVFTMALEGLTDTLTDIAIWLEQGSCIRLEAISKMCSLYFHFPLVCVACQVNSKNNELRRRMNQKVLQEHIRTKNNFPSTEGFIFRRNAIKAFEFVNKMEDENGLHLQFIIWLTSNYILNPVKTKFFTTKQEPGAMVSVTNNENNIQLKTGFGIAMMAKMYRLWGRNNNKYVQGLFYMLLELPLFFEYDEKNETYYQTAY